MRYPYATLSIAAICGLVFLLQQFWYWEVFNSLALVSSGVWARPWTLISYTLVHADIIHIGYNMFALLLFGSILESVIGSRKFLAIYLVSGLAAGIAGVLLYTASIGASGAVFGVIGCLALLRPRLAVWVMGAPMPMIIAAAVWILIDILGIPAPDNIAHEAHIFGIGIGIAAGLLLHDKYAEPLRRKRRKQERPTDREIDEWEERYMK